MAKIYTKTGDKGQTGLVDGSRVDKDHSRVKAYGEVDELNCVVGLAHAWVVQPGESTPIGDLLREVQRDLFAIGAQLADPKYEAGRRSEKTVLSEARVEALERKIDEYEAHLPKLRKFILPAGAPSAAWLHLARTVCRRAEREVVSLSKAQSINPLIVTYLNRLSDLFFVLARVENQKHQRPDVEWE